MQSLAGDLSGSDIPGLEFVLKEWLEIDLDEVFRRFAHLTPDRAVSRGTGDTRFLFLSGTRQDRVALIAHADTVWDGMLGYPGRVSYQDGVYTSLNPEIGLGADDHSGCAMVWALRDLGHSFLILAGEEKGCLAGRWLADCNPDILDELNQHQFMVEFDRRGSRDFKCYDVGSDAFRAYIESQIGYAEPDRQSGTDVRILARRICGVNLSVGFYEEHSPNESLVYADWAHTHQTVRRWLQQPHLPRFERSALPQTPMSR